MRTWLLGCLVVCGVACYDPKLGQHPYLCGPGGACPDGFSCDSNNVCVSGQVVITIDAPTIPHDGGSEDDAGHFGIVCTPENAPDRDLEPNDNTEQADQGASHLGSSILCHPGSGGCDPFGAYVGFAICKPGDVDYFGMQLNMGDRIQVQVLFHVRVGDLDAAILDATGRLLAVASGEGDNEIFIFTAPTTGKYYLLVEGFMDQTNTYDLSISKMD